MHRRNIFAIATILISLVVLELTAAVVEHLAPLWNGAPIVRLDERYEVVRRSASEILANKPTSLAIFDERLGWKLRPASEHGSDKINAQGLRADREYSAQPTPGTLRIAVFGDSFVYGSEVDGAAAWTARLQSLRPDVDVLNYGVPAYGPDQALLRYRQEGLALNPRVVMLTITTPALRRMLTASIVFQSGSPDFLGKPRLILQENGELKLLPNPVSSLDKVRALADRPQMIREFGVNDYWYERLVYENPLYEWSHAVRVTVTAGSLIWRRLLDPNRPLSGSPGGATFNASSESFRTLTRIIEDFVREVRQHNATPLILLLPDGYSLASSRSGGPGVMATVASWCQARSIDCLNGDKAFADAAPPAKPETWFINNFHYTPEGNDRVARWLERELTERSLLPPARP